VPYWVASVLLLIFAAGHTTGMLSNRSLGPDADAVHATMRAVHFAFNGSTRTFDDFMHGLGFATSSFLLFSAFVAWRLSTIAHEHWETVAPIAWALCVCHVGTAILSWTYLFAGPGVLTTLSAASLGWGALAKRRAQRLS